MGQFDGAVIMVICCTIGTILGNWLWFLLHGKDQMADSVEEEVLRRVKERIDNNQKL